MRLEIRMLGEMSLRCGEQTLRESDNRARKVWLLLAYLACQRERAVNQEELIALLWEREERSSNPANALKTMLHRLRAMLGQLEGLAGAKVILQRNGCYRWNPEIALETDTERFEALCRAGLAGEDPREQLPPLREALALYQGDFLQRMSGSHWAGELGAYYHGLWMEAAGAAIRSTEQAELWEECAALCRSASGREPYHEAFWLHRMRALLRLDRAQEAAELYQQMSGPLFETLGVVPSEECRALYREALERSGGQSMSIQHLKEQLQESRVDGAMVCQFQFFQTLYQAEARGAARSGSECQLCLVSVSGSERALSRRSLETCMENLQALARVSLRRGDVLSRCSAAQYAVLLPRASGENARKVCQRIIRAFRRRYPHSPAVLRYEVTQVE